MLASGSAIQKIPVARGKAKPVQKTAEFPPHSLRENVFLQTSDSDGKYCLNECPSRSQPTRCQQPQTCEPQIRFFLVPEIHLIYPVGSREIDKFSGKIYIFFKSEQKWRRYHRKIPWPTQTHEKHCSYRFVLCPSCPAVSRLGVRDTACSMAPASMTEFLGAEVWIWFIFTKFET